METFEKYITEVKINQIRVEKAVSAAAKKHLGIRTLKLGVVTDINVQDIKKALVAAYKAGADDAFDDLSD